MPGNRAVFDEALKRSRDALLRQVWLEALTEAVRAVQEFPSDLEARHTVAIALFHNRKYDQAAQFFEELRKHRGDDPETLAYLARSYEGDRDPKRAVVVLLELATLTQQEGQIEDANEALSEAVRLAPDSEQPRLAMAQFFLDLGDQRRAAEQCFEIARIRYAANDRPGAEEALEEALTLDPDNGNAHALRARIAAAVAPVREPTGALLRRDGSGELEVTRHQIDHLITRAMQAQAVGNGTEALSSYLKAIELGTDRADVRYNLGMLYQERSDHQQAVSLLEQSAHSDEFGLSSYYALGDSLRALGRLHEAAEAFDKALLQVDLDGVGRGEADDLIAMFRSAADAYEALGDLSRAASLYTTLAGVFQTKRWGRELSDQFKQRARALNERSMMAKLQRIGTGVLPGEVVADPRRNQTNETVGWGSTSIQNTATTEPSAEPARPDVLADDPFASLNLPDVMEQVFAPLTPLPTEGCVDEVVRYITASSRFMDQGLFQAAIDACYEVIRLDPEYVPIHLRVGEIFERDGRIEPAMLKYRTVIDIYTAREQPMAAIDAYYHFLQLSPDSLVPRGQLAQLLRGSGKTTDAVEQVLLVANTLSRIGQHQRALYEFRNLLEWAPPTCTIYKAYGQTLLKMQRWDDALQQFMRAARCSPDDPVSMALVNLTVAIIGTDENTIAGSLESVLQRVKERPDSAESVIAEYRAALMMVDRSTLHYLLGRVQQVTGQHASAMLSFRQALSLLHLEEDTLLGPVVVHKALADTYIAQDQPTEALEELKTVQLLIGEEQNETRARILQRAPNEAEICRQIATVQMALGDNAEAIRAWKRCVQVDPDDVQSYTQLADLYFRQGKLQLALEQYEYLANLYEQRQQLDLAIATLERAVAISPNALLLRKRLAQLLLRRGWVDRGLEALREVIKLEKSAGQLDDMHTSMAHAADVYELLSRYTEAAAMYRAMLEHTPDDLQLRYQLMNMLLLAGDTEGATAEQRHIAERTIELDDRKAQIEALSQLVALDPTDARAAAQLEALDPDEIYAVEEGRAFDPGDVVAEDRAGADAAAHPADGDAAATDDDPRAAEGDTRTPLHAMDATS